MTYFPTTVNLKVSNKLPILFIVYNRPDKVQKVLMSIRSYKPEKLYIASDGAKKDKPGDSLKINKIRIFIEKNIDWDCKLYKLYQNTNLGCKYGPITGINWFFNSEEQGIILEDDVLPTISFFNFCEHYLELFKNDDKVFSITGINLVESLSPISSHFFTNYPFTWGWATWRNCWSEYNKVVESFQKSGYLERPVSTALDSASISGLLRKVEDCLTNKIDSWDFTFAYTQILNKGLSVVPSKNLIENIGMDEEGTHTHQKIEWFDNIAREMTLDSFTYVEPSANIEYDLYITKNLFNWKSPTEKLMSLKHIVNYIKVKLSKH